MQTFDQEAIYNRYREGRAAGEDRIREVTDPSKLQQIELEAAFALDASKTQGTEYNYNQGRWHVVGIEPLSTVLLKNPRNYDE
jgi:hypothetical protein